MPNVVTYCRVSSDEQASKDISIPAQRKALHRWVDEQLDHALLEEFVDEGESAYAPADKRPGFCRMIAYCRKHDVELILVHKLDRFSRNREESILFKSLLRKHGVRVQSITEHYDPETPQGFLYEGMIEVINQFYSMNLATETLKGMRENAERGHHNGGRVPYGYRLERVPDAGGREHSRLVVGPDAEVEAIRTMFDLAVNGGLGCKSVANEMNRRKVPAPRSRHWNTSTVAAILGNRVYVGDQVWNKRGKDKKLNPESDWIVVEGTHEGLVDRELFEKRQAIASKRTFRQRKSEVRQVNYLLSRMMRCEHCGSNFVGRRQKYTNAKGETYDHLRYYCGGYLRKGASVCPSFPIVRDWLEEQVLGVLRTQICAPARMAELERLVRQKIDARRQTYGQDPGAVQRRIDAVDARIQNYYRAIGEGLDPAVCREHIATAQGEKERLEAEARTLRKEDYYQRALETNLAELRRFASAFNQQFDELPFPARRQVVLNFIDDIAIKDFSAAVLTLKVPFDSGGVKLLTDEVTGKGPSKGEQSGDQQKFLHGPIRGAILRETRTPGHHPGFRRSGLRRSPHREQRREHPLRHREHPRPSRRPGPWGSW